MLDTINNAPHHIIYSGKAVFNLVVFIFFSISDTCFLCFLVDSDATKSFLYSTSEKTAAPTSVLISLAWAVSSIFYHDESEILSSSSSLFWVPSSLVPLDVSIPLKKVSTVGKPPQNFSQRIKNVKTILPPPLVLPASTALL